MNTSTDNKAGLPRPFTLRVKMLSLFGAVFALTVITLGLIIMYGIPFTPIEGMNDTFSKDAIKELSYLADMKKYELMSWLSERRGDMRLAAESKYLTKSVDNLLPDIKKYVAARLRQDEIRKRLETSMDYQVVSEHLRAVANVYGAYDEIMIADAATWIVTASIKEGDTGHKLSGDERFTDLLLPGQEEIVEIRQDPRNKKPYLYIVRSIMESGSSSQTERNTKAVLIAKIDVNNFLNPLLNAGVGLGETGEIVLINSDGKVLTSLKHPLPDGTRALPLEYVNTAKPAMLALDGVEGIITDMDYRGNKVLAATRHMTITADMIWGMVVKIDEEEVFRSMRRNIYMYLTLSFLGALMVLGLTYMIAVRLSRPLELLSRTARKIEAGDLTARSTVTASDEIGSLSAAFNSMAEQIQNWHEMLEHQVEERTESLRKSEERLRLYYDLPFIGMAITSPKDKRWLQVNDRLCEIFGYPRDKLIEMTWPELTYPEDLDVDVAQFNRVINGETDGYKMDKRFIRSDGQIIYATIDVKCVRHKDGSVDYFVATVQDISDRKKLEVQLLQAQKMESIGILAGGVAHDFNNALTAIIGFAYILKNKLKDNVPLAQYVEHIITVSNRAAVTVSSLLAFSRKQLIAPHPVDLNIIVSGMEQLLKNTIGEDIDIIIRPCSHPLIVMADRPQIEQALINLATNARDAMPQGGRLTIETDRFYLDAESAKTHVFDRPGHYGRLIVSDTGEGMDKKTIDLIFEPFFTTKEVGRGTGLGLAMVYGLVKQHDGNILVYSEPGKGTTFKIYLPLIESATVQEKTSQPPEVTGGAETILVAEDNKEVRDLFKNILERFGYRVITAEDGPDAVYKFNEHKDVIRLCILDVIMPKKSGKAVLDEISKTSPDIKSLFISGYTANVLDRQEILDRGFHFISKPVSPETLLQKVRAILDSDGVK